MVRVYATGMGPLPWEKPRFLHGSCSRTWQMVRPMLEAGHEVCLVAIRVFDPDAPKDLPLVEKKKEAEGLTYILTDELRKFVYPEFHQSIIDQFRPEVVMGVTTPACKPLGAVHTEAPIWADIHGYVMGEAQLLAEQRQDNRFVYEFWKRYHDLIYRADCFSTTSNIQRHALVGELGALGRLNRYSIGHEFVYSIPLARPDEELKRTKNLLRGKVAPQDAAIVLWLGGYNDWCDPETLFHGLERAMEEEPKVHFVSTGGKIHGVNDVTFPRFQALVEKSPHRKRFHFQGWIESADIPVYLLEADMGINVDRVCYESVYGARHRIVEMLRAGLPVVTTRMTEISRDMERAGGGLASPAEDPDALAANILEIARRPAARMEMGINGRELFLKKYTDEITTRPLLEWLQEPTHAPDWGKDIPRREHLLYEHLQSRPFWRKVRDFWHSEKARRKQDRG